MFSKLFKQRIFIILAVLGGLVAGLPMVVRSQSLPGLTIFGGPRTENQLNFRLDFGGKSSGWDRYRLRIPSKKMKLAVSQFAITYPTYYDGKFDTKNVEIVYKDKSLPIQEVRWDKDNFTLEIFPQEPVPAGGDVEIILSNVKNPDFGGMYYFNCQILTPGDAPLLRYLGTWVLAIE